MSGPGWDVLKRAEACVSCAAAFSPRQEIWTRLAASGSELKRADFCDPCWRREGADPAALFWKGRFPEPKEKPRELFDAKELFVLLQRLLEEGLRERDRLCYLLALFCARKRLLKLRGIDRKGGEEFLVFRTPRTRKEYRIRSVEMGAEEMAAARDEMARLAETSS